MRKSVTLSLAFAASVVPAIVAAQQAGTSGSISREDMFVSDDPNNAAGAVDLKKDAADWFKDAARNAWTSWNNREPGQCPKPTITVSVAKGSDPLIETALAQARRDALKAVLGPNAERFTWVENSTGPRNKVEIGPAITDKAAPRIMVTPPSGKKMKSGRRETIKVTVTEPESGWQSGIKRIQVEDVDQHSNLQLWDNPAPTPRPCGNAGLTKTIEATGEVPAQPVWHLKVTAFDYANNSVVEQVQYPTGDWFGTFGWTHICAGGGNRDETRGIGNLTLDHDGRGNLTGTLAGSTPERAQTIPPCSFRYVAPGTFSAKLVGSYTPGQDTFSAQAAEGRTTPGRASFTCPGGTNVTEQAFFTAYEGPMFRDAFRDLRRQPDGSRKSSGEHTFSAGGTTCTTTYSLTLRQAQN
jgi:hypothetical protein